MRLPILATAIALLLPAAAQASTVSVRQSPDAGTDEVHYVAAPGEPNRVVVAYAGDARSVTVSDPGAVIAAIAPCVATDAHTAVCTRRPEAAVEWLQSTRVELGDGNDELRTTRPGPAPIGGVIADGGPGTDLLDGGAGPDELDGGGGTDTLLGGELDDVLTDGDGDADAGPDAIDGGAGSDAVSYAGRAAPVTVKLGDAVADGAAGEGDTVSGIEDVTGGSGDDVLIGDSGVNDIQGGPGDDVIEGHAGIGSDGTAEFLRGGRGADDVSGGRGPDLIFGDKGIDALSCGRAGDIVFEPRGGELLPGDCNRIQWSLGETGEDTLGFEPHPRSTTSDRARFRLECPFREILDGEPSSCSGKLTLREATGNERVLGRGRFDGRGRDDFPVDVELTDLGARLARRDDGVLASASVTGSGVPDRGWEIRLRTG
jgi:hypothetical protein